MITDTICYDCSKKMDADIDELDAGTPWVLSAEEGAGGLHPDLEEEVFTGRRPHREVLGGHDDDNAPF